MIKTPQQLKYGLFSLGDNPEQFQSTIDIKLKEWAELFKLGDARNYSKLTYGNSNIDFASHSVEYLLANNLNNFVDAYNSGYIDRHYFDSLLSVAYKTLNNKNERGFMLGLVTRICLEHKINSVFMASTEEFMGFKNTNIRHSYFKADYDLVNHTDIIYGLLLGYEGQQFVVTNLPKSNWKKVIDAVNPTLTKSVQELLINLDLNIQSLEKLDNYIDIKTLLNKQYTTNTGGQLLYLLKSSKHYESTFYEVKEFLTSRELREQWIQDNPS